ncbi:hypothetical protein SAMN05192529_1219 [Arachidicoccus rhizosphaerae]|uniref:Uncharacterized protein n=1 Tax=Arachidicoccus rhizosphaerae TaxID=551991 RepID=A0A1H4BFS4_9BACT|nr:hypothetical protein SAMN05192529_1219 [Arachidicoccus rhizosphaerae]
MRKQLINNTVLIPIGIFIIVGTLMASQLINLPDMVKGFLFGIGIGLMFLFFIFKKFKPTSDQNH